MPIEINDSREHIAQFLSRNNVGVLATVDAAGQPHAATVYITSDRNLNFYFVTKKDTQKNRNLQNNARAAIALFEADSQTTVQAEGTVSEVKDTEHAQGIITEIWSVALKTSQSHIPPTSRLAAGGYVVYMLSAPSVRMATFSQPDPAQYERIFETVNTEPTL